MADPIKCRSIPFVKSFRVLPFLLLLGIGALWYGCTPRTPQPSVPSHSSTIRFASYNVALFRSKAGELADDLQSGDDTQIKNVAAVIQHIRPDVIALLEFDYDPSGQLLQLFQHKYLSVGQHGQKSIEYKYMLQLPSNTGVPANADYNNDGKIALPNDAYGFGKYEGQYAFALLSKYPLDIDQMRSFQHFRWRDMPDAKIPKNEDGTPYYNDQAWEEFRLSSKNHIDVPVKIGSGKAIHLLVAHPTPPVFDGPEDRNGLRNFDEIRLLKEYITGADYLIDDRGRPGGLAPNTPFVVMGDLNADPVDGDSAPNAIGQLLTLPQVNQEAALGNRVPASRGGKAHNRRKGDKGDPAHDTAFFGARIDYVLPSKDLKVVDSGVFWPAEGEELHEVVKGKAASDHLLVWVGVE